jgi:hypothetical protein
MTDQDRWIDQFHAALGGIRQTARELRGLSAAFSVVGSDRMAAQLLACADNLIQDEKQAHEAVSRDLNEQVQAGNRMFGEVLVAAMGGLKP